VILTGLASFMLHKFNSVYYSGSPLCTKHCRNAKQIVLVMFLLIEDVQFFILYVKVTYLGRNFIMFFIRYYFVSYPERIVLIGSCEIYYFNNCIGKGALFTHWLPGLPHIQVLGLTSVYFQRTRIFLTWSL
jgi:hypothetical protein